MLLIQNKTKLEVTW